MINNLREQMNSYFVGQSAVTDNVIICLLAGGHILLEGVPGVGKTTLAKVLAKSIDSDFGRIQFTPDTLPSDVVGTEFFNMKTGDFEYREGAIMHQILLVDEINRTSPKTQAGLLEAMAEGQVTVGGVKYPLPSPFLVIATQNPVEFMGTYPLAEASIDRFMMKIKVDYPEADEEVRMAQNMLSGKELAEISPVLSSTDIIEMQKKVALITIKEEIIAYAREIVNFTRSEKKFTLGASPRAVLALIKASQAHAFIDGRDYVKPDDVKAVALMVLAHRLELTSEAKIAKEDKNRIINSLILQAKVPF